MRFVVTTLGPTCSDNLVSLTQLTKVGAIFAFTRYDISCMLQVVTANRVVSISLKEHKVGHSHSYERLMQSSYYISGRAYNCDDVFGSDLELGLWVRS